jgi:hypothetical protein
MLQLKDMKKQFVLAGFLALGLSACTSTPPRTESPVSRPAENTQRPSPANGRIDSPETESIDEPALQRSLGLEKPDSWLGYAEKAFDTCLAGYGYSKVHNCRAKHFVIVHFQMLCRDSEGTVSEVVKSADLIKNAGRNVRWSLGHLTGATETDGLGYGQIHVISSQSQKQARLKLVVENDFLYLRAGEVTKIVTPRSWCR